MGFDRKSAAKFSLLLSIPAILGATTLELYDLIKENNYELSINILNAAILSFTFSLLSIHFMMKWISNYTFTPFVIYRVLLGTVLLLAIYFW
jgi:undecaprenyl-diphosphatase